MILTLAQRAAVALPPKDPALRQAFAEPPPPPPVQAAPTVRSLLGTHARAIVSDGRQGYLGSANVTGPGLDEHFELGVRLTGPAYWD
jgi:phosphatidylserine/phosphatidylglycerophosphate/cardiolipin synthase-like enzyme